MSIPLPESITTTDQGFDITWQDGHRSVYPHRYLRSNCMCATCVDEMSRQRRVGLAEISEGVRAEDWIEVGQYAIQILWSDVHSTGIYSFELLRGLCPCDACEAVRGQQLSKDE